MYAKVRGVSPPTTGIRLQTQASFEMLNPAHGRTEIALTAQRVPADCPFAFYVNPGWPFTGRQASSHYVAPELQCRTDRQAHGVPPILQQIRKQMFVYEICLHAHSETPRHI
jgi:hypothetical protein